MDNITQVKANKQNNMEKHIVSMLEHVLKEESDNSLSLEDKRDEDEIENLAQIFNKNNNLLNINFPGLDKKIDSKYEKDDNIYKKKEQPMSGRSFEQMKKNINNMSKLNINETNDNAYKISFHHTNTDLKNSFNRDLNISNFNCKQPKINQPQIFINNIPVINDFEANENHHNKDYFFLNNNLNNFNLNSLQNKNSSPHASHQMKLFNSLSPISKQMNNNSPRNLMEENLFRNKQMPVNNRLTVGHIGMNIPYNLSNQKSTNGNAEANDKANRNFYMRNNTINSASANKLTMNTLNDINTSTCTSNSNVSNLNISNDQILNRSRHNEISANFNLLSGTQSQCQSHSHRHRQEKNDLDEEIENRIKADEKIELDVFELIKGKFFRIVTSQNGSRIMQNYIFKSSELVIKNIFEEISVHLNDIITNVYGNYFCQKFFCVLDVEDRLVFLNKITENILENSKSKVGTYPLQAIIDNLKTEEEKKILFVSLVDKIMELSLDSQAAHVIEKILNIFVDEEIEFIYNDILENFMLLANHMKGLCVVKKAIQQVKHNDILQKFKNIITDNALALVHNPYGNYAIQTAFECWSEDTFMPILNKFIGKFYVLSMQKYSSNVVEKCLEKGCEYMINKFVEEICSFSRALDLMKSSYGNYVMQKALKVSKGENKNKLIETINGCIDKLNDKKLVFKWKQIGSEATGKNLSFPNVNFGNLSGNFSPNTSFNSINSNISTNSRNSGNGKKNNQQNNCNNNNHYNNINNSNNKKNNHLNIFNNQMNTTNNINNANILYYTNQKANFIDFNNVNMSPNLIIHNANGNLSRCNNNSPVNFQNINNNIFINNNNYNNNTSNHNGDNPSLMTCHQNRLHDNNLNMSSVNLNDNMKNLNYLYIPKNFSKSYNNSPNSSRLEQEQQQMSNFNSNNFGNATKMNNLNFSNPNFTNDFNIYNNLASTSEYFNDE